jgi:RNAse (barnase) inhibitor barstar
LSQIGNVFISFLYIYSLNCIKEEGKIKNTITRSFELQDYKVDGTELSGFWADLLSKEELIVEVNYSLAGKETFSSEEVENLIRHVCRKCDSFKAQLPENIRCEVTFKNFEEKVYRTSQSDFKPEPDRLEDKKLEEFQVAYRFYVEYYI